MPSPFPGMDPYLEHPEVFPDFHDSMIVYLKEALQPRLPESYFARSKKRAWIEITERYVEPDVDVIRPPRSPQRENGGGTAVAVGAPPRTQPILVTVPHDERSETFLEIHTRKDGGDRLVTSIEILSPSNKTPGEQARDLYLQKQKEILNSKVNLVEIDLLRGGEHTTAVPKARLLRKVGAFDYHVSVHPFDQWDCYFIYSIQIEESLPDISIPLLPGDAPVAVNLQEVFNRCYEVGAYHRQIRYLDESPAPPLSAERMKWAKGLLHARHASGAG